MGAVLNRMIPYYGGTPDHAKVIALLVVFVLLATLVPIVSHRYPHGLHLLFAIEIVIVVVLLLVPSDSAPQDYYSNLVLPLCGLAMWYLPQRQAIYWTIAFAMFCMVSMVAYYGTGEGFSFGLTYVAGTILVSVLTAATIRSEQAHRESQRLLAELQTANRKLHEYAQKVEILAAVEERNRLARELHDSVSQTIFSMTLTAQAARILLEDANQRVAALLDHLQALSQNALAEMRTLIQELRPRSVVENGLTSAVRDHVAHREAEDGLRVEVVVRSDRVLPEATTAALYRVVQEALNNVVKHAKSGQATVTLDLDADPMTLSIEDHGVGFEPAAIRGEIGHVGLSSMEERVRSLGGVLTIDSGPGAGTRVTIAIDRARIVSTSSAPPMAYDPAQGEEE
jgi:signal transduction histidine kinase